MTASAGAALAFGQTVDYGFGVEIVVSDVSYGEDRSWLFGNGEYVECTIAVSNHSPGPFRLGRINIVVRSGVEGFAAKSMSSHALSWEGTVRPGRRAATRAKFTIEPKTMEHIEIELFDEDPAHSTYLWQGAAQPDAGKQAKMKEDEELTPARRVELRTEALAELDAMVGLAPVKREVRLLEAQCRMAELRQSRGLPGATGPHHLIFAGPPGTGKTTVARVVGKLFAGLGLLDRGHVVEAGRGDLVGRYVGQTAVKTAKVVDSALGGVLFIDEAYALSNTQGRHGDRDSFGDEALQVLLTRAENDRNRLVIVLAGYRDEISGLLATNPGLSSRFNTRIDFPSFTGPELATIAGIEFARIGQRLSPAARRELDGCCGFVVDQARSDVVGNGRFVRTLVEKSLAYRDLRLVETGVVEPYNTALTSVLCKDIDYAAAELLN